MNVVSYNGGKVHTAMPGMDGGAYPLCRGGGMNQQLTKFRFVDAELSCKTCLTYESRRLDARLKELIAENTEREVRQTKGEDTMTKRDETTTHVETIEQITANIERASSLAEAENAEGLAELNKETETLISSLPSRGRYTLEGEETPRTWAGIKKYLRDNFRMNAEAKPKDEPKGKAVVKAEAAPVKSYTDFEGVEELVAMGAERMAEGVRLHVKTSDLAKEIASISLDIMRRIPNKDGNPDIMLTAQQSRDAMSALLRKAGEGFERTLENEKALKALQRSIQYFRTDARAQYLRALDGDSEEAAEERAHFAAILADKPEDVPASEWVAKHYDTGLKGKGEIEREKYHQRKELASGNGDSDEEAEETETKTTTPDDKLRLFAKRVRADVVKVTVDDFENASDETKAEIRGQLEEAFEALKQMIKATI